MTMWTMCTVANFSGKHLVLSVLYLCHRAGIKCQWRYMWQWQKRASPWWWSESSTLHAYCVRIQAMHCIFISCCIVGVLIFQNDLILTFCQCVWMWTYIFIGAWFNTYRTNTCVVVFMYIGQVCVIICMPPRIVYKNPPHNADLPCPCQPAGSPVRVKWLMIQIQIGMQIQRKHMEKNTGWFINSSALKMTKVPNP